MQEQPNKPDYTDLFIRFSERIEGWLRKAIYTALALLLVSQMLLAIPQVRKWAVKVERLEGVPYEHYGPVSGP